jgi:hypothetical protein
MKGGDVEVFADLARAHGYTGDFMALVRGVCRLEGLDPRHEDEASSIAIRAVLLMRNGSVDVNDIDLVFTLAERDQDQGEDDCDLPTEVVVW